MIFRVLDHLCDELKNIGSVWRLDAPPIERSNVVPQRLYRRTSTRRVTRMQETASPLKSIVDELEMGRTDGAITDQSLVEARYLYTLEEAVVSIGRRDCILMRTNC